MKESSVAELVIRSPLDRTNDPILRVLAKGSSLTRRQLEALLVELESIEGGRRISYASKARTLGVSKGTYARIVSQASKNVREAMFTVLLVSYLGLLGEDKYRWFIELGECLQDGRIEEAIGLLDEMQRRLRKVLEAHSG